jgi:hypothetical protein
MDSPRPIQQILQFEMHAGGAYSRTDDLLMSHKAKHLGRSEPRNKRAAGFLPVATDEFSSSIVNFLSVSHWIEPAAVRSRLF